MKYEGNISGTGNEVTRKNEITADGVAAFRYYATGYTKYQDVGGVVDISGYNFACEKSESDNFSVNLQGGVCFAYGYFAEIPPIKIDFLPPAVKQYHVIYAELDKSKIPNSATVKTKNNQSSSRVLKNTLRQDELSIVKTGVFQIPLWNIELFNSGVESITDLRKLRACIENVVFADSSCGVKSGGRIGENVTCPTPLGNLDKQIVNCKYVVNEIQNEVKK